MLPKLYSKGKKDFVTIHFKTCFVKYLKFTYMYLHIKKDKKTIVIKLFHGIYSEQV